MPTSETFIVTLQQDENDDLLFEIPDQVLETLGWTEGDELEFEAVGDSVRVRKVESGSVGGSENP